MSPLRSTRRPKLTPKAAPKSTSDSYVKRTTWRSGKEAEASFVQHLVVSSALRVIGIVIVTMVFLLLAWRLRAVLLLLAVAIFIAALLHPFVLMFERRNIRHTTSVLLVYLIGLLIACGIGFVVFHPVYTSATKFANTLPNLVKQAQQGKGTVGEFVKRFHLANYVSQHSPQLRSAITRLSKPALAVGKTVVSGVFSVVTIVFVSFFVVLEAPKMFNGALKFVNPDRARLIRRVAQAMARQVTLFMLGDFATSVIAGVVCFVALEVCGVPFAGVLAIWVGLVDFLPLVGGLLAGVPTVGIAFLHSVPAGIAVLIVFLVYQQVENHVLYPIIVSRTVELNPLLVLLAVLLGAEIGGIIGSTFGSICGAILAVPIAGSIQIAARELLAEYVDTRRTAEEPDTT